jgi:hypothetical protein
MRPTHIARTNHQLSVDIGTGRPCPVGPENIGDDQRHGDEASRARGVKGFHASIRAEDARSVKAILKVPGIQYVGTGAEDGCPWRHYRWPH